MRCSKSLEAAPSVGYNAHQNSIWFMPHQYNRVAFEFGAASPSPLLKLYCSLVVIELRLKDHLLPRPGGHRVVEWLSNLGEASLAQQFRTSVAVLVCTDRAGNPAPVDANSYPDLRYLRHETDYAGTSTDTQLENALTVLAAIKLALANRGVPA